MLCVTVYGGWCTRYTDMHAAHLYSYLNFITFGRSSNEWTEKLRSECAEQKKNVKEEEEIIEAGVTESEWEPSEINRTTA